METSITVIASKSVREKACVKDSEMIQNGSTSISASQWWTPVDLLLTLEVYNAFVDNTYFAKPALEGGEGNLKVLWLNVSLCKDNSRSFHLQKN